MQKQFTPRALKDAQQVISNPGSFTGRSSLIRLATIVAASANGHTLRQTNPSAVNIASPRTTNDATQEALL